MSYEEDRLKRKVRELEPKANQASRLFTYLSKMTGMSEGDVEFALESTLKNRSDMVDSQFKQAFMTIKLVNADAFQARDEARRDAERKMELEEQKRKANEKKRLADLQAHDAMNKRIQEDNKAKFDAYLTAIVDQYRDPVDYNSVPYDEMKLLEQICKASKLELVRCGFMWTKFMVVGVIPKVTDFSPLYQHLVDLGIGKPLVPIPENLQYSYDSYRYHSYMIGNILGTREKKKYFIRDL